MSKGKVQTRRKSLAERVYEKIDHGHDVGACHLWTGDTSKNGYATVMVTNPATGKRCARRAQRVLMELHIGRPLKPTEHVLHKCGGPKNCMNIAHLAVGGHQENIDDAVSAGQMVGPKLSKYDAAGIAATMDVLISAGRTVDSTMRGVSGAFRINEWSARQLWRGRIHDDATGMSQRCEAIKERGRQARLGVSMVPMASNYTPPFMAMH